MFHIQARAAAGYGNASMYMTKWESMCDGGGEPLKEDMEVATMIVEECKIADLDDGLGEHTLYRIVSV